MKINGKLRYEEEYQYAFYGKSGDIYTDTSCYNLRHSKFIFYRFSIGSDFFAGSSILCVEPKQNDFWFAAPTSFMGGIYLLHKKDVSSLLESGILIFWNRDNANRLADGFGLGKVSLKVTTDIPKLAPYLAVQVIGGPVTNNAGRRVNRRHFGFVFGGSIFENKLEVDILNLYYHQGQGDKCFSISGGMRFNLYKFNFFKKTTK